MGRPRGEGGHLVCGHAHQHVLTVYLNEQNFLPGANGEGFNRVQALAFFAQHGRAVLHFSQSPQQCQQQTNDQGEAERVLQPVEKCPSGVHVLQTIRIKGCLNARRPAQPASSEYRNGH